MQSIDCFLVSFDITLLRIADVEMLTISGRLN
jgi:hypothetical protein